MLFTELTEIEDEVIVLTVLIYILFFKQPAFLWKDIQI